MENASLFSLRAGLCQNPRSTVMTCFETTEDAGAEGLSVPAEFFRATYSCQRSFNSNFQEHLQILHCLKRTALSFCLGVWQFGCFVVGGFQWQMDWLAVMV